jgi:undecaprenyl-diphosphatase
MTVSLLPDGVSVAGGALLAAFSLGLPFSTQALPVEMDRVNGFDRLAMFGYSRGLDVASDVLQYTTAVLPLALALGMSQDQAVAAGVIYFEVLSNSFFAKNALKFLLPRVRPWVYLAPESGAVPETWEGNDSFPSGHATMAFAAAAYGITVAVMDLPSGSPWLLPFAVTEASLAVLTASFRVFSGMHFMTDVLAGALIGTVIGVALPLIHTSWTGGSIGQQRSTRVEIPVLGLAI